MFETVLATSNSLITYRRRYRSFMQLPMIIELLLCDANYPRALAYQLRQLQRMIGELPQGQFIDQATDCARIKEIFADLSRIDPQHLLQAPGKDGHYPLLEELLAEQKERLETLSEALMKLYFSPTLVRQRLGAVQQARAL